MKKKRRTAKVQTIEYYIESFCGMYTSVARRLGVDRSYVSRVAKGERRSHRIEAALVQEFDKRMKKTRG